MNLSHSIKLRKKENEERRDKHPLNDAGEIKDRMEGSFRGKGEVAIGEQCEGKGRKPGKETDGRVGGWVGRRGSPLWGGT